MTELKREVNKYTIIVYDFKSLLVTDRPSGQVISMNELDLKSTFNQLDLIDILHQTIVTRSQVYVEIHTNKPH